MSGFYLNRADIPEGAILKTVLLIALLTIGKEEGGKKNKTSSLQKMAVAFLTPQTFKRV